MSEHLPFPCKLAVTHFCISSGSNDLKTHVSTGIGKITLLSDELFQRTAS